MKDQKKLSKKSKIGTTSSAVEEVGERGIVSAALNEEYVNIDDEALTSDVTTDEDIVREWQKENIN